MILSESGNVIVNKVHSRNAPVPILVSEDEGKNAIDVNPIHPWNAPSPILLSEGGNSIVFKEEADSNEPVPILVTELPNVTDVNWYRLGVKLSGKSGITVVIAWYLITELSEILNLLNVTLFHIKKVSPWASLNSRIVGVAATRPTSCRTAGSWFVLLYAWLEANRPVFIV
jgi:hypothetical protein